MGWKNTNQPWVYDLLLRVEVMDSLLQLYPKAASISDTEACDKALLFDNFGWKRVHVYNTSYWLMSQMSCPVLLSNINPVHICKANIRRQINLLCPAEFISHSTGNCGSEIVSGGTGGYGVLMNSPAKDTTDLDLIFKCQNSTSYKNMKINLNKNCRLLFFFANSKCLCVVRCTHTPVNYACLCVCIFKCTAISPSHTSRCFYSNTWDSYPPLPPSLSHQGVI